MTVVHLAANIFLIFSSPRYFPLSLIVSGIIIIGSILLLKFYVSKEFLKSAFHAMGLLFTASLYRKEDLYKDNLSKDVTRNLIRLAFAILIAAIIWMLLLAYNIVFLKILGGLDWMLFNLYSVFCILIGIDALATLQYGFNTHVYIKKEAIVIDNTDYSNLLSAGDIRIFRAFATSKKRKINCSDVMKKILGKSVPIDKSADKCSICLKENYKATLCSDYKRIYNQINKLKRFLETMNTGTILAPPNKMDITTEGWSLQLFENTKIHINDIE